MLRCPECNSDRLIKFGLKFAKDVESKKRCPLQQYQCKDCGRITVKPITTRSDESGRHEIVPQLKSLLSTTMMDMRPGDHACAFFKSEEEHRQLVTPFIRRGLERGDKVLYILDVHSSTAIQDYLRDDGLNPQPYLASGQLMILSSGDTYLRGGTFDADRMIALLRSEIELSLSEGYSTIRGTGEMSWAPRGVTSWEQLIEYEAKLNPFLEGSQCLAMCQYDWRIFPKELLYDVLLTHHAALCGLVAK